MIAIMQFIIYHRIRLSACVRSISITDVVLIITAGHANVCICRYLDHNTEYCHLLPRRKPSTRFNIVMR